MVDIITRAEWGARPPKYRIAIPLPSPELWLHHSVSATGGASRIRGIQNFHMDERGWPDIAYTFLINALGEIYEGVPPGFRGTHTAGHNVSGHAICLLGNFNTVQPTAAAIDSLVGLVGHGHDQGWWPQTLTGGHRDTRGADLNDCPGNNLYDRIPAINKAILEDDVRPSEWTDADWAVFNTKTSPNITASVLAAEFGGSQGSPNRKPLTSHILDIKSAIGALDLEGVSEAELDERVASLAAIINAQPAAFINKLKDAL